MGGQERYPREAARTLRQADRARAEAALVRAQDTSRLAEAALERARAALSAHVSGAPGAPPDKRRGSAAELRREAAYARAHAEAARRLREELRCAERVVARDRRVLDAARALVTRADGAERVMDLDRARFDETVRKRRESVEEDHADEVAGARRKRP